ncbi:hypothetical protein THERMOS_1411 [Bathymodiolus thermophilus thioautotrophic gill symbiont]|uniref:Uncharacterized protein n=1 Tax=Bathymodiolus thermophilus thioautotrophic gill symbiont TaxID=2360 RepID=A0A8H8XDX2_9GAMM|nr:hypothetical protein THERMOS_1411 [Bathymodiolus thermophilus thioautotrophic gill symbiont]
MAPAKHSKLSDIKEKLQLFAINKAEIGNNKKWISENKQGFELKYLTH